MCNIRARPSLSRGVLWHLVSRESCLLKLLGFLAAGDGILDPISRPTLEYRKMLSNSVTIGNAIWPEKSAVLSP